MNSEKLNLYLPPGIDLESLPGNGERPARIAYFGHLLTTKPYCNGRDFITLNSRILCETLSARAFTAARHELQNLIEIDQHFTPGVNSMGYRWGKPLRGKPAVKHTLNCPRFIKHLRRVDAGIRKEYTPLEQALDSCLQGSELRADVPELLQTLPPKEKVKCEAHRRNVILATGKAIQEKDFGTVKTASRNGRIHCCVNGLSSHLRKHLTLFGQTSVEIDLSSSQPYFLAAMWGDSRMIADASAGSIYKSINEQLSNPVDFSCPAEYATLKIDILALIYARPINGQRYWEKDGYTKKGLIQAVDKTYPGLMRFIDDYRRTQGETALPIAMQKRESDVFIKEVLTPLLLKEDIPAIPIHDAILCRWSDADHVEELIYRKLIEATDIPPTLKRSTQTQTPQ